MNILGIARKPVAVAVLGAFLAVGTSAFIVPATTEAAPRHRPIRHEHRIRKPISHKRHIRKLPVRHEVRYVPARPHRMPRHHHRPHRHHHGSRDKVIVGLVLGAILAGAANN